MTTPSNRARVTESYREWLSRLPDEDLRALLSNRSDVLSPAPKDFDALASRLTLPMHVADALELHIDIGLITRPAPGALANIERLSEIQTRLIDTLLDGFKAQARAD